jgi:hypothetical protein
MRCCDKCGIVLTVLNENISEFVSKNDLELCSGCANSFFDEYHMLWTKYREALLVRVKWTKEHVKRVV